MSEKKQAQEQGQIPKEWSCLLCNETGKNKQADSIQWSCFCKHCYFLYGMKPKPRSILKTCKKCGTRTVFEQREGDTLCSSCRRQVKRRNRLRLADSKEAAKTSSVVESSR